MMTTEDGMRFAFLMENKTNTTGIVAEHGLSVYIETEGKKILFDAGATDLFAENAKVMGIDLAGVDMAVVSHGHYDHTGGFPLFCTMNDKAPVYIHKNAFRESYILKDGELYGKNDGIRWTEGETEMMKERLVLTDAPLMITDDMAITGTIEPEEGFTPTERFYYRDDDGNVTEDDMSHEQCLVIRRPEGLYIFSGCSHTGVLSALKAGKKLFPGEKVAVLVAGMHLYAASADERRRVVDELVAEAPERVMPVHCTGMDAICELRNALGDRCVTAMAGEHFREHGERDERV